MSKPSPEQIFKTCQSGAQEAAEAVGRAFDCNVTLAVEEPSALDPGSLGEQFAGAGLLVLMAGSAGGACVAIPAAAGLLPDWYTAADPTSRSKLDTLAQELGLVLLPEDIAPEEFTARHVANLREAIVRGSPAAGAVAIPLLIDRPEAPRTEALLVWPLEAPRSVWEESSANQAQGEGQPAGASQPGRSDSQRQAPSGEVARSGTASQPAPPPSPTTAGAAGSRPPDRLPRAVCERMLPSYTRSLLRIKLPAVVVLARKKQPLSEILKLVPGAIIQFDKSCEEPLEMEVGGRLLAKGEAVKVGEKFGLRILSMVLPEERFRPVQPQRLATAGR